MLYGDVRVWRAEVMLRARFELRASGFKFQVPGFRPPGAAWFPGVREWTRTDEKTLKFR